MLSICAPSITPRLQYTLQFVFGEVLKCQYQIVTDNAHVNGPCINYGLPHAEGFSIPSSGLLFQHEIKPQQLSVSEYRGSKILFATNGNAYPFDVFSSIFYLISRYEEYLPHEKDMYGRYSHVNSIAYSEGFLNYPLVDKWLMDLAEDIKAIYPAWKCYFPQFKYKPTYDIDIAWSYKNKGLLRNVGGWLSKPELIRLKVLMGLSKDPYDSFNWLQSVTKDAMYFILCADKRSQFDKNISPTHSAMQGLIKRLKNVGIHPSYFSSSDESLIASEKSLLEKITSINITSSRQHYLKFELPNTFRALINAGITDEYSMGFGTINGFRASTSHSFPWYDLAEEQTTELRIHPFCYMDANSIFEQKFTVDQITVELQQYYDVCKKYGGTLITIFHNHLLGKDSPELREVYQHFLKKVNQ